jgi:Sel1 repeat
MFRLSWTLVLCFLTLTSASPGQKGEHPVSGKVKELLLIQRAEKGDAEAQAEITHQAEAGNPRAEAALGENYEYGFWVAKDHTQALAWYRKAAEHGDIGAREIIGQMYFDGKGVQRDFAEAARWFRCPKPSEAILASCKEITYKDLPVGAVQLLQKMKCEVAKDVREGGSNYDDGSAVDLSGNGKPFYEMCCSETVHGPCGAVVIGNIDGEWKDLTEKRGLMGFSGACNGFLVLDSQHNGLHDVCLPDSCSTPVGNDTCAGPEIWQFRDNQYQSVPSAPTKPPRQ